MAAVLKPKLFAAQREIDRDRRRLEIGLAERGRVREHRAADLAPDQLHAQRVHIEREGVDGDLSPLDGLEREPHRRRAAA